MRYWIYWNDLVQGPFEPGELASLRAFTADLSVCEENREDWMPAAAVVELLPYFQSAVASAAPVLAAPPPPPKEPPHMHPLQGEFFVESSKQQTFFDQNGSKGFLFRSIDDTAVPSPDILLPPLTSPFRFGSSNLAPAFAPVDIPFRMPPVVLPLSIPPVEPEIPPEMEFGIREPEELIMLEPSAPVPAPAPPVQKPVPLEPPKELPKPVAAPLPPPPLRPAVPPPPISRPAPAPIPQQPVQRPVVAARAVVDIPDFTQPRSSIPAGESEIEEHTRLWPWMLGVVLVLASAGGGMWFMRMHRPVQKVIVSPPVVDVSPVQPAPPVVVQPLPPVEPPAPPPPVKVIKKAIKKPMPKPLPVVKVEPAPPAEPVAAPVESAPEKPVVLPGVTAPTPYTAAPPSSDWRGREQEAIDLVMKQKIYDGKRTIGENAQTMLDAMHEKELLHAADTGERLYQPDKITWSALHEEGPRFRVYLNFLAWQANGERTLARSDQFAVDLGNKAIAPLDDSTRHDFYDIAAILTHTRNAKASDIQTMLDGVDALNRHKLRAVILKASKQKDEQKKMRVELQTAEDKLQRQVVYFRTKYAEKTLQNISKAFDFAAALKGK